MPTAIPAEPLTRRFGIFDGKTVEQAKAAKADVLKAYSEKLVLTRGRVSAEYRKTVCMNLLGDFLTEKGI